MSPSLHSHSHPGADGDGPRWPAQATTRKALLGAVGVALAATIVGLVLLWPTGDAPAVTNSALGFAQLIDATVEEADLLPCAFSSADSEFTCNVIRARVTEGPELGAIVELELPLGAGLPEIHQGDDIVLSFEPTAPPEAQYQFADFQRETPLALLAIVFIGAVVALGRMRGALALAGLAGSLLVLGLFVLPGLLRGSSPLAVALVGSSLIAFIALYLAHGVSARTTVALLGSLGSLLLTGVLALVFVGATRLTGLADESAGFLLLAAGQVDLEGLLLAGIVIGSLGVLDDVTVTQVSAVWELHHTDPTLGPARLYRSAVRIGRDHIASTVNTLVLAYAGASLPLLLLFTEASRPLGDVLTGETVAVEVVRTLVGSIGLVASVPITTALAALVVGGDAPAAPAARAPSDTPTPTWDDFAPDDRLLRRPQRKPRRRRDTEPEPE